VGANGQTRTTGRTRLIHRSHHPQMRCQGPRTPSTCPILLLLCYFHHCTNSHTEHTDTGFLVGANVEKDIVRRRRGLKATRCDLDVGTVYHFESHRYGQVVIMDIMPRLMGTQYDPKTVAVPRDTVHLRARAREVSRNSRKGPKLRVSVRLLLQCAVPVVACNRSADPTQRLLYRWIDPTNSTAEDLSTSRV